MSGPTITRDILTDWRQSAVDALRAHGPMSPRDLGGKIGCGAQACTMRADRLKSYFKISYNGNGNAVKIELVAGLA
jgi:hypothetical protein